MKQEQDSRAVVFSVVSARNAWNDDSHLETKTATRKIPAIFLNSGVTRSVLRTCSKRVIKLTFPP